MKIKKCFVAFKGLIQTLNNLFNILELILKSIKSVSGVSAEDDPVDCEADYPENTSDLG